ncbi:MAG TPA: HAMP domain-containing sensor histidine kinase [Flavisolibacter sp.]|jgi:two-component system, OmpR family, phosphate regulon sensor histidine kinase PhoR|nr:HAMP domain-containing sensor histidine kinase [Flavisolibacter sp.]
MFFRSKTIRLAIFVSTFIIAAIIIFQLIWLRKVYYYEQKEFDHAIAKVARGFYEDVDDPSFATYTLSELITNPNEQTFFVRMGRTGLNVDSTRVLLQSELEDEDIFTDCYVAFYNASKKKYDFTIYLPSATADKKENVSLPFLGEPYNHLTLYFPHRNKYILSKMNFWIISSIVLLLVLILLGSSIYYLYRQQFLNEIQKDFVNNFTHEFKTPVSVINLASEVLTNPATAQRPEKLARYAAIVQYQGNYLQEQIERLLRHAYSETNLLHLQKRKINIQDVIEEAINNLQTLIASRHAEIERNFKASDPHIIADKGYLLIVITNLIENALKYSEHPKINISTRGGGNEIVIAVRDNGKGIERKYQNKIFKKFYRVPNGEQASARGFGLGLAFVKRIVQSHHGKISVKSEPGVGSEFSIFLPVN